MTTSNFTERRIDDRRIANAVNALYDLWKILDSAVGDSTDETTACSLASELLPIIGGKLDVLAGGMRTGCFDEILSKEGIAIAAPDVGSAEVCHV